MTKLLGWKFHRGTFVNKEGKEIDYDNVKMFLESDADPEVKGFSVAEVNVKRSASGRVFDCVASDSGIEDALNKLVGKEIDMHYSPLGNRNILTRVSAAPVTSSGSRA